MRAWDRTSSTVLRESGEEHIEMAWDMRETSSAWQAIRLNCLGGSGRPDGFLVVVMGGCISVGGWGCATVVVRTAYGCGCEIGEFNDDRYSEARCSSGYQ